MKKALFRDEHRHHRLDYQVQIDNCLFRLQPEKEAENWVQDAICLVRWSVLDHNQEDCFTTVAHRPLPLCWHQR